MKTLITLVVCCTTMLSVFAQGKYNTVTINYNGQNRQILIDGRTFTPVANTNYDANAASGARSYNFSIITNELAPGTHKLQVVRQNNRRGIETAFILRTNYDLAINVEGNGSLQKTETLRSLSGGAGSAAMSTSNYNALYTEIRGNRQATSRFNMIQSAFTNTSNYFSTTQARRLILLINGEPFRLQLAKAAVRSITDTRNVNTLGTVLASQSSRNDLSEFIRLNGTSGGTVNGGANGGNSTTAMSASAFEVLLNDIRNRYQAGSRFNALRTAFSANGSNYFSTAQTTQLVQLLSTEDERLEILKASYKRIIDPINFTQTYSLLNSQGSRDELVYYVRMNGGNVSPVNPASTYGSQMNDASFTSLYEGIRSQYGTGVKKREVMNAFANTNNFFSTYQAAQLVQLEQNENDRLDLAKASLRSITDRQNLTLLYNALTTQSARDQLADYINGNSGGTGTTGTTNMTPMTDASFSTLLEDTRRLWIPGAKKATVLQAFANPDNHFTTLQAMQLIQLDSNEDDRLDLAKASYKTVVDKANFSKVYTIFPTQSFRENLIAYVNSVQ